MMEIKVAKSAGFCFGVNRAVDACYEALKKGKVYTYGPLIHNKEVIRDLEARGAVVIEDLSQAVDGTVLLRSHGVGKDVYDALEARGIPYVDGTCPYVKKIHRLAAQAHAAGRQVIIIGDGRHPEVMGISGWCEGSAVILDAPRRIETDKPCTVVVQTTFRQEKFWELVEDLKAQGLDLEVCNTICSATAVRQEEAVSLSRQVDKMLVIGDKQSSNTQKLFEICQKNCGFACYIETIEDLVLNIFRYNDKIGVTAGASTAPATIKEVVSLMSEFATNLTQGNDEGEELTFQQLLDQSFVTLHTGDVVKGTVISVVNEEVSVNLGFKSDGVIPRGEYSSDPNALPSKELASGDEIEVFVVRVNDGDGNVLLSKKRVESLKGMEDIEKAYEEKTPVTGKITEVVKGGIIAMVNGIRVFIPSSQVSNRFVEDLTQFKGQDMTFKIIELDRQKRRIIGGRKEMIIEELNAKKAALFDQIQVGEKVQGTVSRLTDFGAFVDLGGVDGLIHISEMSWGRIANPRDVLSEGEAVEVMVLDADREKGKISLSLKGVTSNPWTTAADKYAVGSIVEGKVVRMVPFGAFIELEPGVDGLVHISQIANKHVVKPEDELTIGEIIKIKVLEVNPEQKKISLSKREADAVAPVEEAPAEEAPAEAPAEETTEEA